MGSRLGAGKPSRYVTSHPDEHSHTVSGREVNTSKKCADTHLRLENKGRVVYSTYGKSVHGR